LTLLQPFMMHVVIKSKMRIPQPSHCRSK
jgi:hypothetical protein